MVEIITRQVFIKFVSSACLSTNFLVCIIVNQLRSSEVLGSNNGVQLIAYVGELVAATITAIPRAAAAASGYYY